MAEEETGSAQELPGLQIALEQVIYHRDGDLPEDRPHAFIYYLCVRNLSQQHVQLLGRKWVLHFEDGHKQVIEGDKIVGQIPDLAPGEEFSYNSYHLTATNARAEGALHGRDETGNPVFVRIPSFEMIIPTDGE